MWKCSERTDVCRHRLLFIKGDANNALHMTAYRRFSLIVTLAASLFATLAQGQQMGTSSSQATQYHVPAKEKIPVAFVITDQAVTIDFSGPWEVFKDVFVKDRGKTMAEQAAFRLYTVSDSREPVTTSGGMRIIPDYTFDDAPAPAIVVVPAQRGRSPKMLDVDTQDDHAERSGDVGMYGSLGFGRCGSLKSQAGHDPPSVL